MSCKIQHVLAKNGNKSEFYRKLAQRYGADVALNAYTFSKTSVFKERYGDWESGTTKLELDYNEEPKSIREVIDFLNEIGQSPSVILEKNNGLRTRSGRAFTFTLPEAQAKTDALNRYFETNVLPFVAEKNKEDERGYSVTIIEVEQSNFPFQDDNLDLDLDRINRNRKKVKDVNKELKDIRKTNELKHRITAKLEEDFDFGSSAQMKFYNRIKEQVEKIDLKISRHGHPFKKLIELFRVKIKNYQKRVEKLKGEADSVRSSDKNLNQKAELLHSINVKASKAIFKINQLQEAVLGVYKEKRVENLIELAKNDLNTVEGIITSLDKPVLEDLFYAKTTLDFWQAVGTFDNLDNNPLLKRTEIESAATRQLYEAIGNSARLLNADLQILMLDRLRDFLTEQLARPVDMNEVLKLSKDVGLGVANFTDISRVDNEILQGIFKAVAEANNRAEDESKILLAKADKILVEAMPFLPKGSKMFDIFKEQDQKGRLTGRLVSKVMPEYARAKTLALGKLRDKDKPSKADYKNFDTWQRENELFIDFRLLFPEDNDAALGTGVGTGKFFEKDEADLHRQQIIDTLGQAGFDQLIIDARELLDTYKADYRAFIEANVSQVNRPNAAELEIVKKWVFTHSPFWAAKRFETGKGVKFGTAYINAKQTYCLTIPRKYKAVRQQVKIGKKWEWQYKNSTELTGYYNENFEKIENNEKLKAFYNFFTETVLRLSLVLPESKREEMMKNGIPVVQQSILEMFSDKGFKAGWKGISSAFIEMMRTDDYQTIDISNSNPATGEKIREVSASFVRTGEFEISQLHNLKILQFEKEKGRVPNPEESLDLEAEAADEIAQKKSYDLGKVIKAYTVLTLSYKHKAAIQDQIHLASLIFNQLKEQQTNALGGTVKDAYGDAKNKPSGLQNLREMLDYFLDNFDNYKTQPEEFVTKKRWLTRDEKNEEAQLNALLEHFETLLDNEKITPAEYEEKTTPIIERLAQFNKKFSFGKFGDAMLQFAQIKGLGWNIPSAISNLIFGFISNLIESAGGRFYKTSQYFRALWLTKNSIGRTVKSNLTPQARETGDKIRALMDKFNVLQDTKAELHEASEKSWIGRKFSWLSPYALQTSTEYLNQAPLLIAMMMNSSITAKDGTKHSLWDAFDSRGLLKEEFETDENIENWQGDPSVSFENKLKYQFQAKLTQVIKRNHGNYDLNSPIKIKKTIIGRALSQFRRWMFEGFMTRFEGRKYDTILNDYVKGRYKTLSAAETSEGNAIPATFAVLHQMKEFLSVLSLGKYQPNRNFKVEAGSEVLEQAISDLDIANFRKNAVELILYTSMFATGIMLHMAMAGDDEEEEYGKFVGNFLFNNIIRAQTDLTFYVNPMSFEDLTRNSVPAFKTVADTSDLIVSIAKYFFGKDEYKTGIYSGESKLWHEVQTYLPGLNIWSRIRTQFIKFHEKQNSIQTEFQKQIADLINEDVIAD